MRKKFFLRARLWYASFACLSILSLPPTLPRSVFALPNPATLDWSRTRNPDVVWRWCQDIGKAHWFNGTRIQDCTGVRTLAGGAPYVNIGVWCMPSRSTYCDFRMKGIWTSANQSVSGRVEYASADILPGTIKVFTILSPSQNTTTFKVLEMTDSQARPYQIFP
jgi:hypothetical protein